MYQVITREFDKEIINYQIMNMHTKHVQLSVFQKKARDLQIDIDEDDVFIVRDNIEVEATQLSHKCVDYTSKLSIDEQCNLNVLHLASLFVDNAVVTQVSNKKTAMVSFNETHIIYDVDGFKTTDNLLVAASLDETVAYINALSESLIVV